MKNRITWEAPEFEYFEKNRKWFIVAGAVTSVIALWGIFTNNFLFVLLIALGFFCIVSYAIKKPKTVQFQVAYKGVQIDETLYPYDNLRSFCIIYDPPYIKELSLRSKKTLMPYLRIPLDGCNTKQVKEIEGLLKRYIPRKAHRVSIVDNIDKLIRF